MSQSEVSTSSTGRVVERNARVSGDPIPYLYAGESGTAVVLIHGGAGDRNDWSQIVSRLARRYRVYAPDLIGFGQTTRRDRPHTVQYLSDFVRAFMDTVGLERAALIGHSVGARVCLEMAKAHPNRATSLVLVAPVGFGGLSPLGRVLSTVSWFTFRVTGARPPYPRLAPKLVETDEESFSQITCPALVLWGSRVLYFPAKQALRAVRMIPNASLKIYSGAGHAPQRSTPDAFVSDVLEFLAGGSKL